MKIRRDFDSQVTSQYCKVTGSIVVCGRTARGHSQTYVHGINHQSLQATLSKRKQVDLVPWVQKQEIVAHVSFKSQVAADVVYNLYIWSCCLIQYIVFLSFATCPRRGTHLPPLKTTFPVEFMHTNCTIDRGHKTLLICEEKK